jgi:hypothetical protein
MAIKLGGSQNSGAGNLHNASLTASALPDTVIDTNAPIPVVVKTSIPVLPVQEPSTPIKATVPIPAHRESGRRRETINHPDHYGGKDNPYEAIKVIRAWNLSFSLGNTVKYIARAGKKDPLKKIEDLHKAMWYLQEEINSEYEKGAK